jgi:hypothetical protein
MYQQIDIFSDLIALDLGIIHPTIAAASKDERPGSINEALASMTDSESRRCRRKFRKLVRQHSRPEFRKRWSSRRKRSEVMMQLRSMAWNTLDDQNLRDNDE